MGYISTGYLSGNGVLIKMLAFILALVSCAFMLTLCSLVCSIRHSNHLLTALRLH